MTDATPEPVAAAQPESVDHGHDGDLGQSEDQGHSEDHVDHVEPVAVQPVAVLASVALGSLVAVCAYAGAGPTAAALAFGGGVLAWGWPGLLGLPSPRGTSTVLVVAVAATLVAVGLTTDDPFLRWLPAGLAVAMLASFTHQLARRDGRPRLVESVASTVFGIAVVTCGAGLLALTRIWHGETVVAMAMAAVAVAAVLDLIGRWRAARPWVLPVSVVAGAAVAVLVGWPEPTVTWGEAALLGAAVAAVSHAVRAIASALPAVTGARSQLASGCASVLTCGVVVYVVGRLFVA